jgi:hypothetical protein
VSVARAWLDCNRLFCGADLCAGMASDVARQTLVID